MPPEQSVEIPARVEVSAEEYRIAEERPSAVADGYWGVPRGRMPVVTNIDYRHSADKMYHGTIGDDAE